MPLTDQITLQPQQQRLRDDAGATAARGEPFSKLVVWQVGSGKGLGAYGALDALGGNAGVIAPAAVRPTLKQEGERALGQNAPPVISYQQAARQPDFRPETLIVDEAQRLGSPGSSQARAIVEKAHAARNVILLSGTPIRNHPREAAPLISALTRRPFTHDDFDRQFVGTEKVRPGLLGWFRGAHTVEQPTLKNVDELKHLLAGKVDYYENTTPPPGAPASVTYEDVEAELTPRQAQLYEAMMGRMPAVLRWKLRWNYPLTDDELARTRSFLTGPRQLALSDYVYRPDGDPLRAFDNSGKLRVAFGRLQRQLDSHPASKAIVYSNFPEAGLVPYAAALAKARIPHAVFHGGLSDVERKQLVSDFNAGKIRAALVGPSGSEGISLKGSQLIQLLDNHWNEARTSQAQARGIRFDSHLGLPDDLRDVTVERYSAKLPLGVKDRVLNRLGLIDPEPRRATVDDYLRNLAAGKERLNTQFMDVLRDVAQNNRLAKTAADRINAGDAIRLVKLAALTRGPAAEYCPHCDARLERDPDSGRCNSCGKPWPAQRKQADLLPGGKGDNKPDTKFPAEALATGVKHEKEHTPDKAIAKEIAKDHLTEDEDYYQKLEKIEKVATHTPQYVRIKVPGDKAYLLHHYIGANYYDHPAGRVEPGEDFRTAAIRELRERAGYEPHRPEDMGDYTINGEFAEFTVPYHRLRQVARPGELGGYATHVIFGQPHAPKRAVADLHGLPFMDRLRLAKMYSDMGTEVGFQTKSQLIRRMVVERPTEWRVDSWLNPKYVGLTHVSGFRYHLPVTSVSDLPLQLPPHG